MSDDHKDLEKSFINIDLLIAGYNKNGKSDKEIVKKAVEEIEGIRGILEQSAKIIDTVDPNVIPSLMTARQLEYIESIVNMNTDVPIAQFFKIISMLHAEVKRINEHKNVIKPNGQDA